jgi:hypothetical protein
MFTQVIGVKDCDKYDMSHAPSILMQIAQAYKKCRAPGCDIRTGDGFVELKIPLRTDFRILSVLTRISKDGRTVWLSTDAKYFKLCLTTDKFDTELSRFVIKGGSVDWLDAVPRLELCINRASDELIKDALDALRANWTAPVGQY